MIHLGGRAAGLPPFAAAEIALRKRELLAEGVDVIDLGAGDAPLPPPELVVRALSQAAAAPELSRYPFQLGLVTFREAVARFMAKRFGVSVDPMTEVLPLLGSKEGLAHLPFAVLDPGDVCLVPEPGYPAYRGGAVLAGADVEVVPLRPVHDFLVALEEVPAARLARAKLLFLNYPNNPTGATAPLPYLERVVEQCRRHGIILAFDNPYSELTFDGYRAPSIFEIEGAKDVAVEFHSFSKTFGMTGWRLGWVTGNRRVVSALSKVKSYVDTGAFLAIQHAGATALDHAADLTAAVRDTLQARRDALVAALRATGWQCEAPKATMYLWLPLPAGVTSGPFARDVLEAEGLAVLAGSAFGAAGEGFLRLSYIAEPDRLEEAAARLGRARARLEGVHAGS